MPGDQFSNSLSDVLLLYPYYDKRRISQWNIAWSQGKSIGLYHTLYPNLSHNTDSIDLNKSTSSIVLSGRAILEEYHFIWSPPLDIATLKSVLLHISRLLEVKADVLIDYFGQFTDRTGRQLSKLNKTKIHCPERWKK